MFEVVLGRSPTHQGKTWPRTETTTVRGSSVLCQPQTCLPIGFRRRNREARENYQASLGRKVAERIYLFAPPAPQNAAAEEEQGDIRAETRGKLVPGREIKTVPGQPLEPHHRGCSIGAGPPQPAAKANHLLDSSFDLTAPASSLSPGFASTIDQIALPAGNGWVIAFDGNASPCLGNGDFQTVMQRNGLVNSADLVVLVRPFVENLQAGVDFGKGTQTKCLWQGNRLAGRSDLRLTQRLIDGATGELPRGLAAEFYFTPRPMGSHSAASGRAPGTHLSEGLPWPLWLLRSSSCFWSCFA